ncbi:PPP family 3-phenylpropionic acid transporter [Methylohalomonas lacus]|uniref:PPP family 3-phenylpropionic acid transporter n=1 Tax=Methylohalomonas lacus TaxID=398773 RepID=A0AAE3L4V6_9GAMM|nr:MFS transporter [Methylohalomonas lacus]MCS3904553.1 PPP family 3-phenylpropionic acid transporter [Methylohalomonas lacus]
MSELIPYWRLSGFYFFYFATLGVFLPYWSLYLEDIGFGAGAIGTLTALLVGTKMVAPNVWGWLADHTGQRMRIIRLGSLLACISFAGVLFTQSYLGLALVLLVYGFCSNAALPQVEAMTLNHLRDREHAYPGIRLWGSIGFIAAVGICGWLLRDSALGLIPWIILVMLAFNWLVTLQLPPSEAAPQTEGDNRFRQVIRRPEVIALIGVCLLMQASHGPYYTFFSLYLQRAGYGLDLIGQLWALGVVAEVFVFMVLHRLLLRFGLRWLLLASLALAVLRWTLIGEFVDSLAVIVIAQLLHAATFGIYHAVTIQYIHRYFTGRLQGRGQALYSSLSFGAGVALGSLASGYLWEAVAPVWSFRFAIAASLLALIIAWYWIDYRQQGG